MGLAGGMMGAMGGVGGGMMSGLSGGLGGLGGGMMGAMTKPVMPAIGGSPGMGAAMSSFGRAPLSLGNIQRSFPGPSIGAPGIGSFRPASGGGFQSTIPGTIGPQSIGKPFASQTQAPNLYSPSIAPIPSPGSQMGAGRMSMPGNQFSQTANRIPQQVPAMAQIPSMGNFPPPTAGNAGGPAMPGSQMPSSLPPGPAPQMQQQPGALNNATVQPNNPLLNRGFPFGHGNYQYGTGVNLYQHPMQANPQFYQSPQMQSLRAQAQTISPAQNVNNLISQPSIQDNPVYQSLMKKYEVPPINSTTTQGTATPQPSVQNANTSFNNYLGVPNTPAQTPPLSGNTLSGGVHTPAEGSPAYNAIQNASQKTGIDSSYLSEASYLESGFKPGAQSHLNGSTAGGLFGMNNGTWNMVNSKYNLGLTNKFDPNQNALAAAYLAKSNAAGLKQAGIPVTNANMYIAHNIGIGEAKKLINADPNASITSVLKPGSYVNNPGYYKFNGQWGTVGQVLNRYNSYFPSGTAGTLANGGGMTTGSLMGPTASASSYAPQTNLMPNAPAPAMPMMTPQTSAPAIEMAGAPPNNPTNDLMSIAGKGF